MKFVLFLSTKILNLKGTTFIDSQKQTKKNLKFRMASSSPSLTLLDRFRGCLLGSAVGDCIGTTLEFTARSDREKDWVNDSKKKCFLDVGHRFLSFDFF